MIVLLDREVGVHYGQLYLLTKDSPQEIELSEHFRGQRNGLCGAARPEVLFLITARHTGQVGFRIELHERAPELAPEWAEVVEASVPLTGADPLLCEWGERWYPLDLPPGHYRARYSGQGFDAARDSPRDEVADRYLLQLWPAEPAPDAVLRQHGEHAAYWHRVARELPPQAPPPTAEQDLRRQLRDWAAGLR